MSTTDATTTTGVAAPSDDGEPRWLDEAEMAAWLPLVRLVTLLPQRLDGQLREDAGIGHVYYQILAMLSQARDQHLRMSELAGLTAISPSRLSHAVAALEDRGWVTRCPAATDRRGALTPAPPPRPAPPISPNSITAPVSGSAWNSARQSTKLVPGTGSPPMPTQVVTPIPLPFSSLNAW